ncbi:MAG: carbonic anhydrase [Thermoanaerobaculia bacterium]
MATIDRFLERNRTWSERARAEDPELFERLARGQAPRALWIGCSDSRVPASTILDLGPGELFVYRNVANVAAADDPAFEAVLQYAVEALRVPHVIVCGHTGCGGVGAALEGTELDRVSEWIRPVRAVAERHAAELDAIAEPGRRADRLAELHVAAQVRNLAADPIVRRTWERGRELSLHGCLYRLAEGLVRDLGLSVAGP